MYQSTPKQDVNRVSLITAEVVFILLPFIVIGLTLFYRNDFNSIWFSAEWAFAASLLIGQSLIKLVGGISGNSRRKTHWQRVVLIFALLIVFGLVPSLITLSLILVSDKPSTYLAVLQISLFIIGLVVFYIVGGAGIKLLDE